MRNFILIPVIFIFIFAACDAQTVDKQTNHVQNETKISNEHLVMGTLWFQKSAEFKAITYQTFKLAKMALVTNLKSKESKKPAAVVVDIDETLFDNSPYQEKMITEGFAYSSETWKQWTDLAQAKPLAGALDFLNFAKNQHVEIFYVSNRKIPEIDATIKNMQAFNFPNLDKQFFLLKEDKSDKSERRAKIAENYEIVLLVGDNLADFSGVYSDRDDKLAFDTVDKDKDLFGTKYIILPNPMYGEWEKALYHNSWKWTLEQRDSIRKAALKPIY